MADDLEAFLRQAAQRRAQRNKPAAPRPAAPPPAAPPRPPRKPTPRPAPLPPQRVDDVIEAQVIVPQAVAPAAESSRLGVRLGSPMPEAMTDRLPVAPPADSVTADGPPERFSHQLGSLSQEQLVVAIPAAATPAEELRALLTHPRGVRQAVLLSEILAPPHHRW
jgi:hypothetical protein